MSKFADVIIVVAVIAIIAVLSVGGMIYRSATFNETTITPTNLIQDVQEGGKERTVYALQGEFKIEDTWVIPTNRSSATWANQIDQAVKINNASLTRLGVYEQECKVYTWGVRFPLFSMFPTVYRAECHPITLK